MKVAASWHEFLNKTALQVLSNWDVYIERIDELLCAGRRYLFVIVPGEERTAIHDVVLRQELLNADKLIGRLLVCKGKDVQPSWR